MFFISSKNNFKQGYSIIELIIYIAIFTVLGVLVINSLIITIKSFATIKTNHSLMESGLISMDRMTREIREAVSINLSESVFDSNPGILELNSVNEVGNSEIIKFLSENSILNLKKDNILVGSLIDSNINVTNLVFKLFATTNSDAIRIEMTLQDQRSNKSEKFYNTIILRGGY